MAFYDVLPFIGPSCSKHQLSVLIVSPNKVFCELLYAQLYETHLELNNRWQLSIHTSHDISSIVTHLNKIGVISIDFVIICMDTSVVQCLEWTTEVIRQCNADLLPGRTILVNGSGLPTMEMAVSVDNIIEIKRKYRLQLLNGNLSARTDLEHVSKRIHIVIETVMGLKTGIPHVLYNY